jgi:ribosome-binding protein aMBF1 (putative translation factor)
MVDKYFDHQDWKQVIIQTKKNKSSEHKPKVSNETLQDRKLHKQVDEQNLKHKKVSLELRTEIQQKRSLLKYTQKDLANKINLPVNIINDIETGKAMYNPSHIQKIKRILKIGRDKK